MKNFGSIFIVGLIATILSLYLEPNDVEEFLLNYQCLYDSQACEKLIQIKGCKDLEAQECVDTYIE